VNIRILLLPVVCAVLAACQSVQGERATYVGDGITVDPQIEWTHAIGPPESIPGLGLDRLLFLTARDTTSVWTIDGLGLDRLLFFSGVTAGAPLLQIPGVAQKDMVVYNTTMLPDDVMDMIASTLVLRR